MEKLIPLIKRFGKSPKRLKEGYTPIPRLKTEWFNCPRRRGAHSCPQQVLRLVEYVSEGFKTKQKTVAVFFDVAKAFDRVWHAEQEFRKAPPSLPSCTPRTPTTYRVRRPASLFADDTALFFRSRTRRSIFRHLPRAIDELGQWFRKWRIEQGSEPCSRRNKRTLYKMCIRTVMTYACPVFAHAAPKALYRLLQVIQNKFCRAATDAHWCVRNSILHRDLELPTLPKYEGRIEAILRHRGITPNARFARRSTINRRLPPTLSVGHGTY
ncbi:Probable RNA-directed DNA polymerase from transposon X-element [Eumeta japonica]|uniref:Probable RNA-directed DNA polymerase from transposon X-element n=1 Tax=Eumeta variegata TaxID=151549 RepID=A0A4C1T4U1_EUMVA|nr:Probable RNA-directed DNA polymerase from transposon X-element [Eumeta japonica]